VGDSVRCYGAGGPKPAWAKLRHNLPPLVHYPWEQTYAALKQLAEVDASLSDDVAIGRYINPATGRPFCAPDHWLLGIGS
jgi:gentisate 1,2-dioxygenase